MSRSVTKSFEILCLYHVNYIIIIIIITTTIINNNNNYNNNNNNNIESLLWNVLTRFKIFLEQQSFSWNNEQVQ